MPQPEIELDIKYFVDPIADDSKRFHAAAQWICQQFNFQELSASISVVDSETIHQLNVEHLGHDWTTDVISFEFERDEQSLDGEIIASADMAEKLCKTAGWSQADELLLYVIHGLLHLTGLDDESDAERIAMREWEQACLIALDVKDAQCHMDRWEDITY